MYISFCIQTLFFCFNAVLALGAYLFWKKGWSKIPEVSTNYSWLQNKKIILFQQKQFKMSLLNTIWDSALMGQNYNVNLSRVPFPFTPNQCLVYAAFKVTNDWCRLQPWIIEHALNVNYWCWEEDCSPMHQISIKGDERLSLMPGNLRPR